MLLVWVFLYGLLRAHYEQYAEFGSPVFLGSETGTGDPDQIGYYGFLKSESAFHFRTTLMFAVDNYQRPDLLAHDDWQQYPEGVDAWREYGLLMEPAYGRVFRTLCWSRQSLIDFLLWWIPAIHALTMLAAFFIARQLRLRYEYALAGTFLYALCSLPYHAILTAVYIKETFSLFLLAWFLVAHFGAIRRDSTKLVFVSAPLLGLFLVSWHLAQFLAAVVLAATTSAFVVNSGEHRRDLREVFYSMPLVYLFAALVAGMAPFLAARNYAISVSIVPTYVWVLYAGVAFAWPRLLRLGGVYRISLLLVSGALLVALSAGANASADYSHVYQLFAEQISHGFQKPIDPNNLPFAVRLFWVPPFTPPTIQAYWVQSGVIGVLVVVSLLYLFAHSARRRSTANIGLHAVFVALGFCVLWMLSERLGPVCWLLVPAVLGVAIAAFVRWICRGRFEQRFRFAVIGGVVVCLAAAQVYTVLAPLVTTSSKVLAGERVVLRGIDGAEPAARAALFQWISENTAGPGSALPGGPDVFAADIALSPALLLYAGRPVILNSQFENVEIRDKTLDWLQSLFAEDESQLLQICRKFGVNYIVVDRDLATARGRKSMRYMSGSDAAPDTSCVVGRMHFRPRHIRGLTPVYDNDHYRVFRVLGGEITVENWERGYGRWWVPQNFEIREGVLVRSHEDREVLQEIDNRMSDIREQLDRVAARVATRVSDEHGAEWEKSRQLLSLRRAEADILVGSRLERSRPVVPDNLQKAIDVWMAVEDASTGRTFQAEINAILDGPLSSKSGLLGLLQTKWPEPKDEALAADLCVLAGRYADAARCYVRMAGLYAHQSRGRSATPRTLSPEEVRALLLAVKWHVAAGDIGEAGALANRVAGVEELDQSSRFFVERVVSVASDS